jgi:6-pyruvoyltetrahydropterin/6-carboxytetrahydropterin synthase
MEITRKIVFHTGHMLKDDTSKCFHPHGHEYVLEVTLSGAVQREGAENGMVINFSRVKEILTEVHDLVDHKFMIEVKDPRYKKFLQAVGMSGLYTTDFPPTAENLVQFFFGVLRAKLPKTITIVKVRLQETYQCWVDYIPSKHYE